MNIVDDLILRDLHKYLEMFNCHELMTTIICQSDSLKELASFAVSGTGDGCSWYSRTVAIGNSQIKMLWLYNIHK